MTTCYARLRWAASVVLLFGVSACDLAPQYAAPTYVLPASWHGEGPFTVANPQDDLARGPWWQKFGSPTLNRLETQLAADSPTLAAMAERYTQARDSVAIARAGLFPQLSVSGGASAGKESANTPYRNPQSPVSTSAPDAIVQAGVTWEPDFWQRIRNGEHQQARLAQSSAAQVASAQLSLQVELADSYFALRGLDAQIAIYEQTVANYEKSVSITQLRLQGAIAPALDVARAQAQLASAQALLAATQANRGVLVHGIAALVGANATVFSIAPDAEDRLVNPVVPAGVPSQLLERRPDIASAERTMAAANANIGIARAAFYPRITISATGGLQDTGFNLFTLPNTLWSIGANAVAPVFEGGLRHAALQQSWSQFAETRDNYRAKVLDAFREVEDGLTLTAGFNTQVSSQRTAVAAASKALSLTQQLYVGGINPYLDVVVAQQTALQADIAAVQTRTAQLQATANLVLALGGGWDTGKLPSEQQVVPDISPLSQ